MPAILIATPHARNDSLVQSVKKRLSGYEVTRVQRKEDLSVDLLERIGPEFVFFPHWSWPIPDEIYSRFECVIFHMTDLPYGRGGSPLQNLIVRGHKETKLAAFKCVRELDAGPIYAKRSLSLAGTAEEILRRASALMEGMIADIVEERPEPVPQKGEIVVFKRRRPEDGDLSPLQDPSRVYDFIRMLDADGYPRAFIDIGGLHLEFREAGLSGGGVEARVRIERKTNG